MGEAAFQIGRQSSRLSHDTCKLSHSLANEISLIVLGRRTLLL
jgi:hypothetical protein